MGANCKTSVSDIMKRKAPSSSKNDSHEPNSRDGSPVENIPFAAFDVIDIVKRRVRKKVIHDGVLDMQNTSVSPKQHNSKSPDSPEKVESSKHKSAAAQATKTKSKTWNDGSAKDDLAQSPKKRKISKKSSKSSSVRSPSAIATPGKSSAKKVEKDVKSPAKEFDQPFVDIEVFKHVISVLSVEKRTVSTQVNPNKGLLKGSVTISSDVIQNPHENIITCLRTIITKYRPRTR